MTKVPRCVKAAQEKIKCLGIDLSEFSADKLREVFDQNTIKNMRSAMTYALKVNAPNSMNEYNQLDTDKARDSWITRFLIDAKSGGA